MTTSCPSPQPAQRRKTRWWTYAVGLVCLALAGPLYLYNASQWRRQSVLTALEEGDNASAISQLEAEQKTSPESAETAYWLAVAHRRAGHLSVFQDFLLRAKELGHPEEELQRQYLLMRIQSGSVDLETEQQADELIQKAENYSGRQFDLYVDEFYEAQARGSLANYRLFDAEVALDHWVQARPKSALPRLMRADIRKRESNYQVAEREYREVLELSPGNVEARLQRGHLLMNDHRIAEAVEEFRYCLKVAPQEYRAQLGLAECEYRTGEGVDAARERLLKILEQKITGQERGRALSLLGDISRGRKENELAVKYLRESLEVFPTPHSGPYRTLASAYASLGKTEEAKKYMKISQERVEHSTRLQEITEKIIDSPKDGRLRYEQGNLFLKLGQKDEAAGWWNMAVRLDPQLQPAHEALADYYDSTGDRERTEHHRRLAEKSADSTFNALWLDLLDSNTKSVRDGLPKLARYPALREPVELLTFGLNVVEHKDLEHSAQELGRLTNNPKLRMRALTMLAEALYVLGHYSAAERAYQEVLSLSPRNIVAHKGLQSIYYDLGAYDQMELHALEVAKIDPTDYRPHRHIAFLRREAETWDAAIRDYQESLRRSPHQPTREEVLLELADCYVHTLKHQEALDWLAKARPSAQRSYLEAQCKFATKKVDEARKLLDTSLKTTPDHAPSLLLRSDIALVDDDVAAARGFLEQAVKAAPYESNARQKFSTVLLRLDEKDAAKQEANRAKELLDLQIRFSELNNQASQRPKDLQVRIELAALARQLGREDEAKRWERVVEGMTDDPVPEVKGPTVSVPEGSRPSPLIGPLPKPKLKEGAKDLRSDLEKGNIR